VELSNLNRQVLYWDEDIGRKKVTSAVEKLKKLNPEIIIEAIEETITEANVSQLVVGFDLVVDAMARAISLFSWGSLWFRRKSDDYNPRQNSLPGMC